MPLDAQGLLRRHESDMDFEFAAMVSARRIRHSMCDISISVSIPAGQPFSEPVGGIYIELQIVSLPLTRGLPQRCGY